MRAAMRSISADTSSFSLDMGVEIALLLHDRFRCGSRQPNEVETEAGIEGIAERIQRSRNTDRPIAPGHGLPGLDRQHAHRAIVRKKIASSRRAPLLASPSRRPASRPVATRSTEITASSRPLGEALLDDCNPAAVCAGYRRVALPQRVFEQGREARAEPGVIHGEREEAHRDGFQAGAAQAIGDVLSAPRLATGSGSTGAASSPSRRCDHGHGRVMSARRRGRGDRRMTANPCAVRDVA